MNPDREQKIQELVEVAQVLSVNARRDFLRTACGSDQELCQCVEARLAVNRHAIVLSDRQVPVTAMSLSREYESLDNQMIGSFRLGALLGRGGMGTVYRAFDTRLERQVALKLLSERLTADPERIHRFQREARAISALNHPNILTIFDFGQQDGHYFIAAELVEGDTLRRFISQPDFTLSHIPGVVIQIASALEAAHVAGITHRDIKPENIMVRPDGYVKVLDFGLAKLTQPEADANDAVSPDSDTTSEFETRAGIVLGTVNYMSPEQARGQKVDGRSDLFSLGVVLYELISGHRPFDGETRNHTMVALMDAEAPPLNQYVSDVPAELQRIVSRLLEKNRERRYQTARELIDDLETLQNDLSVSLQLRQIRFQGETMPTGSLDRTTMILPAPLANRTDAEPQLEIGNQVYQAASWKRSRFLAAGLAILITVASTLFYFYGGNVTRSILTEQDTILLADFVNNTGDPVFDGTLKQGMAVQLEQSPYLNLFPEERARETLKLMGRSPEDKITREVGREISLRRGVKGLLIGSIASLGNNYVITLEAINNQSGEIIARQQVEAESKEQVLKALGRAVTELRGKLGESLASIQQFDAPIEEATTASLEALWDYSIAVELRRKGQEAEAVTLLKRATERDNEFALAFLQLGITYRDMRNLAQGNQYLERAFRLRNRVSEREQLEISATYFRHITGELDKRLAASSLLTQTYPQDVSAFHLHGNSLLVTGQHAQAAEAYSTAVRLDPDYALSRANLALSLIGLNRLNEAQQVIEQGLSRGLDSNGLHHRLFLLAFLRQDAPAMKQQIEWFAGKADEYLMREMQARILAFAGQRRLAGELYAEAAALAEARGLFAEKARILANEAGMNAAFGLTALADKQIAVVLALLESKNIAPSETLPSAIQQLESVPPALTLALCGKGTQAQLLADELARRLPLNTIINTQWLPLIRATIELKRNQPGQAIESLQPVRQYEAAASYRPLWVRGQACLQTGNGAQAASEFQRIIEHRGWDAASLLWPLAHLGAARAAKLQGDTSRSREMYQEFFALWKDADADVPLLLEAKKEFAALP